MNEKTKDWLALIPHAIIILAIASALIYLVVKIVITLYYEIGNYIFFIPLGFAFIAWLVWGYSHINKEEEKSITN